MIAGRSDAEVLNAGRRAASLSLEELWLRYFELTGQASLLELEAYLQGALILDRLQYDLIAHALNERFQELGMGHPVPYRQPAEQLGTPDGDDG